MMMTMGWKLAVVGCWLAGWQRLLAVAGWAALAGLARRGADVKARARLAGRRAQYNNMKGWLTRQGVKARRKGKGKSGGKARTGKARPGQGKAVMKATTRTTADDGLKDDKGDDDEDGQARQGKG